MDIINHIGPLAALLAAFTGVRIAARWSPPPAQGRSETIDGLRGYLAFGVFLHHAVIFYFYLHGGKWTLPPSNLFVNLGQASVMLFFMITSFLFYGMLRRSRGGSLDWLRLFSSRITRLTPLYLFAMALLLLIVGTQTGWQLRQPVGALLRGIVRWLSFTALGTPDLNGLPQTAIVTAGVTWSLPYEWTFYLCLPLIALTQRVRAPIGYLLVSAAAVTMAAVYPVIRHPDGQLLAAFAAGMLAVHLSAMPSLRSFAARPRGSVALLAALVLAYGAFPSAYTPAGMALLFAAFTLIASGCDLFGLLRAKRSRVFGEFAYSIYLLHGLALYTTFMLVLGPERAAALSPVQYWGIVVVLSPLLVIGCSLTFRFIEAPMMKRTGALVHAIRRASRTTALGAGA
jgi:peptidoglycan/LPS O-acetylase OafA/YrhL